MTYALGLGVMGVLFLYAGLKGLSLKEAIQGETSSGNTSSASQLTALAFGGSDSGGVSTGAPANPKGAGVSVPKAPWNPHHKPIAGWITVELNRAWDAGARFTVTSGVRTLAEQTAIYNSGVRPAAKPGTSNHEQTQFPGGAVDVNPLDAPGLSKVLKRLNSPLVWAGAKDPVHFSHPHGGSY